MSTKTMSCKAALLCLLALLAIAASQTNAESIEMTSVAPSGVPRRLLGYAKTVTKTVAFELVTKAAPAPAKKEEEKPKPAPAPAPAPAKKKTEIVIVEVPHYCKMWAKFGHIHPDCAPYSAEAAAGRRL
ncbi:hypothetical protein OEZ85_012350 [Tetradesmus obliquus]|uniref:Uncharacterized protein n=1 Tax=Tetradesmus obliquus TaxID=3088 RepID=A0ABY8TT38_TETOB|nr:hypothetical protein OEZ85_012350 [Tetradesmus obliquus]